MGTSGTLTQELGARQDAPRKPACLDSLSTKFLPLYRCDEGHGVLCTARQEWLFTIWLRRGNGIPQKEIPQEAAEQNVA